MMNEQLERQVIELVATDRFSITTSSIDRKLSRRRPELARAIELPGRSYSGERVYARVVDEEGMKARGMKEAINVFCDRHPQYGKELRGLIAEQRTLTEPTLYFGMQAGCRLTSADYLGVMQNLGFTELQAKALYEPLIETSRSLARKRDEERSIVLGSNPASK
jgi:hypothetical protein